MSLDDASMKIPWTGPYGWPKFEGHLPVVPQHPGVYLQTVEYRNGYLICAAGITGRSVRSRLVEHTRKFMTGDYHVLNVAAMQRGVRKVVWRGWDWSPGKLLAFRRRKLAVLDAACKQLAGYRIFVADVGTDKRILERIEAAIINRLYKLPRPLCDIPDKGMYRAGRWSTEKPIFATNTCAIKLYGLPRRFVI